jgi:hypothetical protein
VTPAETYYETPPKILALFRAIRQSLDPELARFGLCVDTAHLWVSGVDLRSREAAQHWLAQLEDPASPERALGSGPPAPGGTPAIVFHLNDSQRPKGVGPDAHAPLAAGKIWGPLAGAPGESGIAAVVDFAARHGCWVVLERKPHAALAGDYHLLRGLAPAYRL